MKKNLPYILIIIIFLAGAVIFLYPAAADMIYQQNGSRAIAGHEEKIEKMNTEEIASELDAARRYNESLADNAAVLTEPFGTDDLPVTDRDSSEVADSGEVADYDELLACDEIMACIEVPSIDVKLPVFHGTGEEALEKGAGHLENTSLPIGGKDTHTVISAHSGLPSARLFTDLTSVREGDVFKIHVLDRVLYYEVYSIDVVLPDDTSSLMIEKGRDLATLVTCTPYGSNTHRLLVHGERTGKPEEAAAVNAGGHPSMKWEKAAGAAAIVLAAVFIMLIMAGLFRRRKH